MRKRIFIFLCLLLSTGLIQRDSVAAKNSYMGGDVQAVFARGYGTVIDGDYAQARDEAIQDARVRALEKAAGLQIDSRTFIQNDILLDSTVKNSAKGYIKAYRVLEEGIASKDLYQVKIEAWVVPMDTLEENDRPAIRPSISVSVCEWNLDSKQSSSVVGDTLKSRLAEEGYTVLELGTACKIDQQNHSAAGTQGAKEPLGSCDLLVSGSIRTYYSQYFYGISSCYAEAALDIIEVGTGKVVASLSKGRIKGFGKGREKAGADALYSISDRVSDYFLEQIAAYCNQRERSIVVRAYNVPDGNALKRLSHLLSAARWVNDLQLKRFKNSIAVFNLRYSEKTSFLATRLKRTPDIDLIACQWNNILVKLKD